MRGTNFFRRLLSVLLILSMLTGNVMPGIAVSIDEDGQQLVTFTRVDNSEVTAGLTPDGRTELKDEEQYAPTDVVRVSIVLSKASTIEAGYSAMNIANNKDAVAYREGLKKTQTTVVNKIEKAISNKLDVVWKLTLAANVISANVKYGQIEAIKKVTGVKDVIIENQYVANKAQPGNTTNMATSGIQTGASLAWEAGYTGAGTRIAVIDTGTDTNHQSLNNGAFEYALAKLAEQAGMSYEAYIESLDLLDAEEIAKVAGDLNVTIDPQTAYFGTKLPFGFNYKDGDYDITHDNDEEGEHGSHVAGIATANSYIIGQDGQYYKALDTVLMQGVAPEAQLLTMKVFGKGGSPYDSDYMAAIEDAVVLGADVVNLSLGSVAPGRSAHANPVLEAIMDDLTKSGVVVTVSAGNSGSWVANAENGGYLYNTDVSMDTVGQPGSFTNSMGVASVENDGMVGYYVSVKGEIFVYNENLFNSQKAFTQIAGEYDYIFLDGVGKAEEWEAVADVLPGKIALCSRGETNFVEKATLAVKAGAVAVLIYNNVNGMINLDLTEYQETAPVAVLTNAQGAAIRDLSTPVTDAQGNVLYRTGKMTVSRALGQTHFNSDYYTMSDFSSWGVPGSLEMKPEITAPGGNIFSLNGLEPSGGGYEIMSGTSMASPQVAGMAALLAQYVREKGLVATTGLSERQLIQSLLMSTAKPLLDAQNNYYPILQQGSGLGNIHSAINADSYITMADGTNSGAADGKVKVELFDDPHRTGAYSAVFTLHNLLGAEKQVDLNADFFIQGLMTDGTHLYMDTATTLIGMDVVWSVNGQTILPAGMEGMDFNGDGKVTASDGQYLLNYASGAVKELTNKAKADVDNDGDIDSHDAYVFLRDLVGIDVTLPANGEVQIRVEFSLPEEMKALLSANYPNGTYIQGYLFAETEGSEEGVSGTAHSIPVLGFYGNWTDSSMFDVGTWPKYATGEETRIPYIGRTRGNEFLVMYANDPGYTYSFGGNPLVPDKFYMPERNAMNSADSLAGFSFIAIRHADESRVVVVNQTSGETLVDSLLGPVNMAYYYGNLGWQNSGMTLSTNFSLKSAAENDLISFDFTMAPEYYLDANGEVDWDALGDGATMSTSFIIDNTAPQLLDVTMSLSDNTMTVTASDNQYIAAVGLYNKTGTRCLASTGAKQEIEKGEVAKYTFSLDKVNGKKFLLQVFDYAMNATTYLIEMQIGDKVDLPEMMAYDLVSMHWTGFTKDFEYDYKVGTPRVAYADHVYYAATIAEHFVFASTNRGELYVMPEDDLTDITYITDLEIVLYDMAYNAADGEIYAVDEDGDLYSIHKLTGDITYVGKIGLNTNTLACNAEGVFYCNELGTGRVYSFTLDTMDAPVLLMEDNRLIAEDEFTGASLGGTTGNMGMEYNPNTGMICWNSHCEMLVGSYITFAYYYEIDPVTGDYTRYSDFWHEMSGLVIPVTGADKSWADPTDEVMAVKLNKSKVEVIRGTSTQLIPNVQPWTATDRTVTWSSADETIATVDKNGVITGVKEGTTKIRATSNLDPYFYAECTVDVVILDVTIHGTLSDEQGNSAFYSWNMATGESWKPGNALHDTMTSVTYSTLEDVFYMVDTQPDQWNIHKINKNGEILQTALNTNGIPLWDMAYSEYFSQKRGVEQVTSIYYYYLLSPKNPMEMDAVGFNMSNLADYLVGVTSMGYEQMEDEEGNVYDTEHLILLDNDGYIWDFWIYDHPDGGMDALYNITKSDLNLEFPGDSSGEHMFTSLIAGEDGNLYLSAFNGETNEIFHISYDPILRKYAAVKIGEVGQDVWPATITSVTVNGTNSGNTVSPKPEYTMSATTITEEELEAAAASRDSRKAIMQKVQLWDNVAHANDGSTKGNAILINDLLDGQSETDFVFEQNISDMTYFAYTAPAAGTLSVTIGGTVDGVEWSKWYAMYYPDKAATTYTALTDTQPGSHAVEAGDTIAIGARLYDSSKWSGINGTLQLTVKLTTDGGEETECTHSNEAGTWASDGTNHWQICDSCGEKFNEAAHDYQNGECICGKTASGTQPSDNLVLGNNSLASGNVYTYTATQDCRLEFEFTSLKDSEGTTIYDYTYSKGTRVKIFINGKHVPGILNATTVTVSAGATVTVQMESVDGDTYTVNLAMAALEPASKLVLGENALAGETDYSFIATQDGTLYTTIMELWHDGTYCTEASMTSSVVFKINGSLVTTFRNSYEVKAGDEITVRFGSSFGKESSAKLFLSYESFYEHPLGSRGNPYLLSYSDCPTTTASIPANSAVWYRLSGFGSGYKLTIKGAGAYVIINGIQYNVTGDGLMFPAVTNLQIGNSGSAPATFQLVASIEEGYPDNPKDLAEGNNKVALDKSDEYYYDFLATQDGTVTFTVTGDYWRFWFSHLNADGTPIVDARDHRMVRDDEATVTVEMTAGQSILLKVGTLNSNWTAPGGEITVNFHFEGTGGETGCQHPSTKIENQKDPTCTETGYTGDEHCASCGELIEKGESIPAAGHTPGDEPTCVAPQLCTVCRAQLQPAIGHSYTDGICDNCGAADPNANAGEDNLVLGNNSLASGNVYTYTATADGRLEFTFTNLKDSEGAAIYDYGYSKGTQVKILINGVHVPGIANATKITVASGQKVTVQLISVDGGSYTATLNLATLAPASKLILGDNSISKDTDYSFIAPYDGTLYTTITELWCDGVYCSEASMSSSVVFRINGVVVTTFENAYSVKAGDEITVLLGTQFGESASAKINLSYDGFYKHPLGSRGNPYYLRYSECPTESVEIPAGGEVWYKLSGFGSGYTLIIKGQYLTVVVGGTPYSVPAGGLKMPAVGSFKIINENSTAAKASFSATIEEGYPDNPKDLVDGDNSVTLGTSDNYYYDFVAPMSGTATFTFSGDNWRVWYSLLNANGGFIVQEEDHRQARGDADTITVNMTAGQSVILKLGTINDKWMSTGGTVTVTFHFTPNGEEPGCTHTNTELRDAKEATCTEPGYTGDTWCKDCETRIRKGQTIPATGHDYEDGICGDCGAEDPNYVPGCEHANTEIRDAKEATCTEPGYTGDTWCKDCNIRLSKGETIPATGHDYQEGTCANCGEADPDYVPDNSVIVDVTVEKDATNGVIVVTWDPEKLYLLDYIVYADYSSVTVAEGSITIGYIVMDGIPAGEIVAQLLFWAVDRDDVQVQFEQKQINNDMEGECIHKEQGAPVVENNDDPSCTEEGSYDSVIYCTKCGAEVSREHVTVPATDHSFTNYISNGDATYDADGTKTATCDNGCGETHTVADEGSKLPPATISSDVYTVEGDLIRAIATGTTAQQLLAGINEAGVRIVSGENEVAADATVGTGMVVQLVVNGEVMDQQTIVVTGDINGDGKITGTDFLQMRAVLLNKNTLTGAAAEAADINGDGKITGTDFIQMRAVLLNKGTITPN